MQTTKPKILFIAPLPPPVHGSAMVSRQIKDSKIINEEFDCDFVNLSTSRRMDEIGKKSSRKVIRFVSSYFRTFWKLLTRRYDLCYLAITCHGIGFLKDAPFVIICKLFRRKILIHQHNKGMSKDFDRPFFKWLFPLVYRNTKVILLSWRLYPDIEKIVDKSQVLICPNGIPVSKEAPKFEKNNLVPRILFLSNLIESKGVLVLLDACKILKEKGYVFRCDFVGGETKEIDANRFNEEVKKRGLDDEIAYLGRKYGEEKTKEFGDSDIFVFPTFYENETFGLVNLEAMANKLPIVTTDEGGIPDVVNDGENGLISERKSPESLAQCIETLLNDKQLREKMGEDGYNKLKSLFTKERFEANFVLNVKKCLNGGGKYVIYQGPHYGAEKDIFFSNADIFVFPTFYDNECFPLVLLEAMQKGLACISSDEGAIPDIIENNWTGIICPRQDTDALAKALGKLLENKELRNTMGRNGYDRFTSCFSGLQFEDNIMACLHSALSN